MLSLPLCSQSFSFQQNDHLVPRNIFSNPIVYQRIARLRLDPSEHNRALASYAAAVQQVAAVSEDVDLKGHSEETWKHFDIKR